MILNYVVNRLREPSSWRGILLLLTVAGIKLSPEQGEAILTGGLAIVGLVGAFLPDRVKRRS